MGISSSFNAKHRTQISLEEWQYQSLLEMSKKTKKSLSRLIREMVTEKITKQMARSKADPVMGIIGLGAGDGSSVAKEHDKFLYGKEK